MTSDQIDGIMQNMNKSIQCIKQSVSELEQFSSRFEGKDELSVSEIDLKLLIDDFFDP